MFCVSEIKQTGRSPIKKIACPVGVRRGPGHSLCTSNQGGIVMRLMNWLQSLRSLAAPLFRSRRRPRRRSDRLESGW